MTEPLKIDDIPRRNRLDLLTTEEMMLHNAIQIVEGIGADPLLTDAVVLLGQAKDKISDYVELKGL